MKPFLDFLRKRIRLVLAGGLVVMIVALGVRLHQGPIDVDALRPLIQSRIEADLPRTRASIDHVELMWFSAPKAVGLRMSGVLIRDTRQRPIVQAKQVEVALAADSLFLAHLMPARVTARDFFVAASVSKQGRYELGYDAHGAPGRADLSLQAFLEDFTGKEKLDRPLSFTRQIRLSNGIVRLVEEGGGFGWTANASIIDFSKLHGRLKAQVDLGIDSGGPRASLKARAQGVVGLSQASILANLDNLVPAKVFPAAGMTHPLSTIDAPMGGLARIDYSARGGFQGGYVNLTMGAGHAGFGHIRQAFDGANVIATYDAATRTIVFQKLLLKAHLLDTDLRGSVHITPEDVKTHRDLSLDFDVYGPRVTGMLADDFAPQTLTDARYRGSYVPAQRSFRFASATGKLNGAPLEAAGLIYTDAGGQLGADLKASVKGRFTKDEVFAFWPRDLSGKLREDLVQRIHGGDFANAIFMMKVKPGDFSHLSDDELRLDFDFDRVSLEAERRLHDVTGLRGHGVLRGNSFSMDASAGWLDAVELERGGLEVPDFHDHHGKAHIWLEAHADVPSVIEAIDPLTDNELGTHGLNRARLSGQAQARVDITFPIYQHITHETFGTTFTGHIQDEAYKQAALGWDLTEGTLTVSGDLLADKLEIRGPAKLGPYTGDIAYATQMKPKTQLINFDGSFNAARFGGSPRVPVPIKGQFTVTGTKGSGTIDAAIFRGDVAWSGKETRPTEVDISGVTLSDGMEDQGLPIFNRLKRELPTRITLLRSGEIWAGEVDAEALSGDIAYIEGERPRMVYKAIITPDEARDLGYGGLPMFSAPRHLTVNVALDSQSKEADIKFDQINAVLGWSEVPGSDQLVRRLKTELLPGDWATLGLPRAFFRPKTPLEVTALWSQTQTELSGQATVAGQDIAFEMPLSDRHAAQVAAQVPSMPRPATEGGWYLRVKGTVDDAMLSALGYTQTPVRVSGPTALTLRLYNVPGQPAGILDVDATNTLIGVQATDWTKPAGDAAHFAVTFDDQGQARGVNLSHIIGTGDHVQVDGRASFSGKGDLQFADFSKIYLKDFIDVAFRYYDLPQQNRRVISLSGQQLDLRPWLQAHADAHAAANAADEAPQAQPVAPLSTHVVVDLGHLQTAADGAFTGLKLDVNWDGKSGFDGQGIGHSMNGAPVTLVVRSEGGYSVFRATTSDLGDVVRTGAGIRNLTGGHAELAGAYMDGQVDATLSGKTVRVRQVPAMAQLLTVATLTGLGDTLNDAGIAFTDFNMPLRYRDHTVFIRNGWVKGKGLGMDVFGTTDLNAKTLDLTGTLIPAYSVNSIFGALPSNGLGLVGIKYKLAGPIALPQAYVNPLSIMMPGFMKVWENRETRHDPIAALNLPKAEEQQLAQLRQVKSED